MRKEKQGEEDKKIAQMSDQVKNRMLVFSVRPERGPNFFKELKRAITSTAC